MPGSQEPVHSVNRVAVVSELRGGWLEEVIEKEWEKTIRNESLKN
jgi:hypothetical protein